MFTTLPVGGTVVTFSLACTLLWILPIDWGIFLEGGGTAGGWLVRGVHEVLGLFAWGSGGEAVAGTILILVAGGQGELVWGSGHASILLFFSLLLGTMTRIALGMSGIPSSTGPYWAAHVFAGRCRGSPPRARWCVAGLKLTDHSLTYLLAAQLALCHLPSSLVASLPPFLLGLTFGAVPWARNVSLPTFLVPLARALFCLSPSSIASSLPRLLSARNSLDLRHTHTQPADVAQLAPAPQRAGWGYDAVPQLEPLQQSDGGAGLELGGAEGEKDEQSSVHMQRAMLLSHAAAAAEARRWAEEGRGRVSG